MTTNHFQGANVCERCEDVLSHRIDTFCGPCMTDVYHETMWEEANINRCGCGAAIGSLSDFCRPCEKEYFDEEAKKDAQARELAYEQRAIDAHYYHTGGYGKQPL